MPHKLYKIKPPSFLLLTLGVVMGILLQKYNPFDNLEKQSENSVSENSLTVSLPITQDGVPPKFQGKLSLFILAGQSNMSGRGELTPALAEFSHPRVFMFGNDYRWHLAKEPIDVATAQVDKVSMDAKVGVSPAMGFATELLKRNPDMSIGLIPCAMGRTSIHEWQKNLSENSLYGSCLKRALASLPMGTLKGLLFFQGESDAYKPELTPEKTLLPETWDTHFISFVLDIRRDLDQAYLPVIFAQLGRTNSPELFINWEQVKKRQNAVQLSWTSMINTDDLELGDNYVHFSAKSYQVIGQRFAKAFWKITEK